jgi:hypothetical protein
MPPPGPWNTHTEPCTPELCPNAGEESKAQSVRPNREVDFMDVRNERDGCLDCHATAVPRPDLFIEC